MALSEQKKRDMLTEFAMELKRLNYPIQAACLARIGFWDAIARKKKPAPRIWIQVSLFDVLEGR